MSTRASRHGRRAVKRVRHRLTSTDKDATRTLLIFGCQRSGTSLLTKVFERDGRTRVFNEFSALASPDDPEGLRLDDVDVDVVRLRLSRCREPLIVAKPLVESQRLDTLLRQLDNASALWIFRDYRDVVSSNITRWGISNGTADIRPIFEGTRGN